MAKEKTMTTTQPETTNAAEKNQSGANNLSLSDVTISVKLKPEEKQKLIQKAVTENGLTVSEFVRYKIFEEEPENKEMAKAPDQEREILQDEEREAYEKLIQAQRQAIADLTEELYKVKAKNIDLTKPNGVEITEDNTNFVQGLLREDGKKWLLQKNSFFGGQHETDLSDLTENAVINAALNYIKDIKENDINDFQKSFNAYIDKMQESE